MLGGATPKHFREAEKIHKALTRVIREGSDVTVDALRRHGLDDLAAKRAVAAHKQGLVGRGGLTFDDLGDLGRAAEKGPIGTRTAARINGFDEEWSRTAVFLKGLDEGMDPRLASQKSRRAMLDYSQEGL